MPRPHLSECMMLGLGHFFSQSYTGDSVTELHRESQGCGVDLSASIAGAWFWNFVQGLVSTAFKKTKAASLEEVFPVGGQPPPPEVLWWEYKSPFHKNKQICWLFCSWLAWDKISCSRQSRCYYPHCIVQEMENLSARMTCPVSYYWLEKWLAQSKD